MEQLTEKEQKFAEDNFRLVNFTVRKYKRNVPQDIAYDSCLSAFLSCIKRYNPEIGSFHVYAIRSMRLKLRSDSAVFLRKQKETKRLGDSDIEIVGRENNRCNSSKSVLESMMSRLSPLERQLTVATMTKSRTEIAKEIGTSKSYVNIVIQRAYRKCRRMEINTESLPWLTK